MNLFLLGVTNPPTAPSTAFGAGVIGFSFALSLLIWSPVVMAALLSGMPNPRGRHDRLMMLIAFWTNMGMLILTVILYQQFQVFASGLQFEEKQPWLPAIGVTYHLGLDGIGMTVMLVSGLVGVVSVLASTGVRERVREYFVLLLLAQATITGVVAARDFFVLLLFWSASAVPLAMLVGGWGGSRRQGAVTRLLAYWGLGSAALLGGGLLLYQAAGGVSFDFDYLAKAAPSPRAQVGIGVAIVVAAATRLPLVPLHAWAREVLAEAPVGVAVLVAGSACRLGGYLLVRLLAGAEYDGSRLLAPFIGVLAALTVIYAALAAFGAVDLRRLGAYLALVPGAVTALGIAGLSPLSLDGAVLSLFAGGLAAALVVGACATLSERAQVRSLAMLGGLAGRVPKLAWLLVLAGLAVLGMPFLATFTAELMVFFGSFRNQPAATFAVAAGIVLSAATIAWFLHRALFGPPNPDAPGVTDASLSEAWYLGILAGALLWVGVVPGGPKLAGIPLFDPGLVNVVNSATADLAAPYAPPAPQR